ncbi:MAG: TIGR04190 family B12-binding domain/radical SAM domain protein [Thermoplasmata archaeon]
MGRYDLVLVHAPSVYDFRKRGFLYGPMADLIPSTPVFEMYPIGFTTIASLLAKNGYRVRVLNLATHMLADERYDADRAISRIESEVFGIDLHWLPHAHGSLEVAKMIKHHHPDSKVVLGGFSATYYHDEIMRNYPDVDAIFLGDSTELPMLQYLKALGSSSGLQSVKNLAYREDGRIRSNGISHFVEDLDSVDFDYGLMVRSAIRSMDLTGHMPYLDWKRNPMLLVSTVRGCSNNCSTCMGGCMSFMRNFGRSEPAFRSPERILEDIRQIEAYFRGAIFLLGDIQQAGKTYCERLLGLIKKERPRNEIAFEFFSPPQDELIRDIGGSVESFDAQISPDSHDPRIREIQGRRYSNEELERAVKSLIEVGARRVDMFFMIGLSGQDRQSVMDTVEYAGNLMRKIRANGKFLPFISPLAPFIDPGSDAFENPGKFGYRLFARTLEDHRSLLLEPSWKYVLSYETNWLSRDDIVGSTYDAGLRLNELKLQAGAITQESANAVRERIESAKRAMELIDSAVKSGEAERSIESLRDKLLSLSESTVCDKRELDWSNRSFYWSVPRALFSAMFRR